MSSSADKKKTTVLVAAAAVVAVAGLGLWARQQQRRRLAHARKQLTHLRFDLSVAEIEAETAAVIAKMEQVDNAVAATPLSNATFATTAQKLIDLDAEMLARVTNVTFLGHVSTSKPLRDACNKADEAIEDFLVKRGMRADVYKVLHHVASSPAFEKLSAIQKRYVKRVIQDFERNGLQLDAEKQKQVQEWKQKLSKLGIQYHQNLTEETTEVSFSADELKGLSDDFIAGLTKGDDDKYKVRPLRGYLVAACLADRFFCRSRCRTRRSFPFSTRAPCRSRARPSRSRSTAAASIRTRRCWRRCWSCATRSP
jgi:thimet oligopeptidase